MNKLINLNLYKSLIESDFILLNNSLNKSNHYIQHETSLVLNQKICALNVLQLVKSIKQLIRLIQFLKKQKNPCLHIIVENKQHFFLLKQYFNDHPVNFNINLQNSLLLKKKNSDSTQMLFSFEQEYSVNNIKTLKRLFSDNIFLIQKINSKIEANNWGVYKIFNELFDFKKIIFLIILLEQSLHSLHN